MSWTFNGRGKNETSGAPKDLNPRNNFTVATETVTLGAAKGSRYSSVIDFIPVDKNGRQLPFTVVSNTGTTNLSGSASDQLYACYTRGGTYFQVKNTLRDCNYADDTNQGTSFRSVDNALRVRAIDPAYLGGGYPYYKLRVLQAAVESSAKTVGLAVMIGAPDKGSWETVKK
ncbi:MAG: hypothetical protein IPJ03_16920 [Ignavibacteriales bacterium]|nr:hypothetical protein [Ignavibacteriales bacterium]